MNHRSQTVSVRFRHAFRVDGVEGELPAGDYVVLTEDMELPTMLSSAYVRRSTWLVLGPAQSGNRATQMVEITVAALDAAIAQDAGLPASDALPSRDLAGPERSRMP